MKHMLMMAAVAAALAVEAVEVTKDWQIAVPDGGEPAVRNALKTAAEEIQRDVEEALGWKLPIVKASAAKGPAFFLGNEAAEKAGLGTDGLKGLENVYAEKNGSVYLFGREDRTGHKGVSSAAWWYCVLPTVRATVRFLKDRLNVRYVQYGVTGTDVPKAGRLTLDDGAFSREKPHFDYGAGRFHGLIYDYANYIFGAGAYWSYGGHSYEPAVPADKYFKDHPEYFSLDQSGKRCGTAQQASQLCLSNPEVLKICTESLERFIEEDRKERPNRLPNLYDFTQMDNANYICRCDRCAEIAKRYDRKGGFLDGGDAGLQLWFVNQMAKRIAEKHPDVLIRVFAYVSTEEPPKGIVPADNVIVWLCDLYSNSDHEVPLTHPANARRLEILKGWAKLTRNLEIWDYMLYGDCKDGVGTHGDFPEVNVDAIAADAKLFRDLGVRRLFMEAEYRDQPFHELNLHAMGACYSDPDCDIEKVVSDYCRVYGAAAPKMREAIDLIRKLELSVSAAQTEKFRWHRRDLEWLTVPNLTRIRDLFAEAAALADTPAAKARTAHALRSATHKLELVQKAEKGDAEYVFAAKALNCSAGCRRVDDRDASDGTAIEVLVRGKDGQVSRPKLPTRMGVYDWDTKKNQNFTFTPDPSAKGYVWYELGMADLTPAATLWLYESWGCSVDLRACYATADGLPESYNRFKILVRAKVADGRFLVDKVRLVRYPL